MHSKSERIEMALRVIDKRGRSAMERARQEILASQYDGGVVSSALRYYASVTLPSVLPLFPALISIACEAVGGKTEKIEAISAAMVLITSAGDIHDDLIDKSTTKYSKKTVFGEFGSGITLLAGALTFLALGLVDFTTAGFSLVSLTLIVVGALLLPAFVLYDRSLKNPMIDFEAFKNRVLRNAVSSAFFLSLGYFSVVFLLIMYLQGIRGLSPLDASLLLVPGYVAGSFLGPVMGRLSDKYGSREIATLGVVFLVLAIFIYLTLGATSPLYIVLIGSAVSGFGTSMFFPANNSAVMANARVGSYGSISGLLRTLQNIGILGSFVLAISVAAASIPRQVAFEVFIGTTNLTGGVTKEFIAGIDHAFYVSLGNLFLAGVLSFIRGRESRKETSDKLQKGQEA